MKGMASKAAELLKDYNKARNQWETADIEADREQEYQDWTAGNLIPWFLGLNGHEKITARWLSENKYVSLIHQSQQCKCDGSCCHSSAVSAEPDKHILRLPSGETWGYDNKRFLEFRQQQRATSHQILTKDLFRVLRTYEWQLTCSIKWMVPFRILEMATAIVKLNPGGAWKTPKVKEEDGKSWSVNCKILNDLEDYGWRVSHWKVQHSKRVLLWCERICERADKHGILFETLFAAVRRDEDEEGKVDEMYWGCHAGDVARVAWRFKPH